MACYPGCNCYYCSYSFTNPSVDPGTVFAINAKSFDLWTAPVSESTQNLCLDCGRELSKTLDAYYGKDPNDAKRCVKCRG